MPDPRCPICHSYKVKGFKVHDGKKWWSRCISGLDHGMYTLDNGKTFHEWPEVIFFSEDDEVETPHGDLKINYQRRG